MNVQAGSARRPFNNTGVYGDEVPPVLIPNTEVKLISADGTWLDTARESMTMPVPKRKSTQQCVLFLFANNNRNITGAPGRVLPLPASA